MSRKTDPAKLASFLELLADGHTIRHACQEAGIARSTVYASREADDEFRALWDDALDIGIEVLEQEARRRAVEGTVRPIAVAGERELVREYSDRLLVFLLKAKRPDVYRERVQHEHRGKIDHTLVTAESREYIAHRLSDRASRKREAADSRGADG